MFLLVLRIGVVIVGGGNAFAMALMTIPMIFLAVLRAVRCVPAAVIICIFVAIFTLKMSEGITFFNEFYEKMWNSVKFLK